MKKFVAGVIVGATLMTGVAYASTATKIEVLFQPIKYYFDGVQKAPEADKAGFIHNGTTYVPVRFISEALGKEVVWDQKTSSIYVGERPAGSAKVQQVQSYENGTYRGSFVDGGYMQVGVEFKLEDNIIKSIRLSYLNYKGIDYLKPENATVEGLRDQHIQLANHLLNKDIREALGDLYKPGEIVTSKVDTFTGATLRAGKIISAVRDGLNRGVYRY